MSVPKSLVATLFLVCAGLFAGSASASTQIPIRNDGATISGGASSGRSLSESMLKMGGPLAAGATFTIMDNGTGGLTGTLFSQMFVGPMSWQLANGTHNYTLNAIIHRPIKGFAAEAITVGLTINRGYFDDSTMIAGANTNVLAVSAAGHVVVGSVPEPSTLALLGTGVVSLLGMLRRKIMA